MELTVGATALADELSSLTETEQIHKFGFETYEREVGRGGSGKEMVPKQASQLLQRIRPTTMVEAERKRIAHQLLAEVRRLEKELAASKARLSAAVEGAGTSRTDIYGWVRSWPVC